MALGVILSVPWLHNHFGLRLSGTSRRAQWLLRVRRLPGRDTPPRRTTEPSPHGCAGQCRREERPAGHPADRSFGG